MIAPTVERAAALGLAFDETAMTTPEDLSSVLAVRGPDAPCVAVTGVPTRGERLAGVLRQVLATAPPDVQILLDVREPAGADLADHGPSALRGLVAVDCVRLWDIPCLRLRRAADPGAIPDLTPWRDVLLDACGAGPEDSTARALSAQIQTGPLRDRIVELEREVRDLKTSLEIARAAADTARTAERLARRSMSRLQTSKFARAALRVEAVIQRGTGGSSPLGRLLRFLVGAVFAVALLSAGAVAVAELTETGYVGGATTAVLGLLAVLTAYVWRVQDRMLTRLERTARRLQDGILTDEGMLRRHAKLERDIAAQERRLKEIEHDLAIIAASTTDIAQSVASRRTVGEKD